MIIYISVYKLYHQYQFYDLHVDCHYEKIIIKSLHGQTFLTELSKKEQEFLHIKI